MSDAYLYATAGIVGSIIGALSSLGTTWMSQRAQAQSEHVIRSANKRRELYEAFIDETSQLYADALVHEFGDPSKLVRLYALISKLRLTAPARMVAKADEVMLHIMELYQAPPSKKRFDLSQVTARRDELDLLRTFSEAGRDDLHHGARGIHPAPSQPARSVESIPSR
ncbi:MAG TPA: hypothetical protein VMH36_16955 [Alphaproteobacteria bacterium]|nr:hypothetical protein [Alphaproteobacteria bacterium]